MKNKKIISTQEKPWITSKKKKIHSAGDDGQYHYNETNRLTTRILPTTRYLGYVINSYCRISNQLLDLLERRLCNQLLFRVKQRQIRKCRFHFCHSNIILKFGNIFLAELVCHLIHDLWILKKTTTQFVHIGYYSMGL